MAVSRTTYVELFETIVPLLGTLTVTLASPGVFTLANHGLVIGDAVYLTTTGALPTGLSANTIYYVMTVPTSSTFTLGASRSTTAVTSAKNTSGSQSGTHSIYSCPWGLGDGSTTFNTPLLCGKTIQGMDAYGGGNAGLLSWLDALGLVGGAQTHQLSSSESGMPGHGHGDSFSVAKGSLAASSSVNDPGHTHYDSSLTNVAAAGSERTEPGPNNPHSTGSSTTGITVTTTISGAPSLSGAVSDAGAEDAASAHNNMQPSVLLPWIVKT